ncbi:MAG: hypothetical protein WDW38_007071 [Sanguina aurantia]
MSRGHPLHQRLALLFGRVRRRHQIAFGQAKRVQDRPVGRSHDQRVDRCGVTPLQRLSFKRLRRTKPPVDHPCVQHQRKITVGPGDPYQRLSRLKFDAKLFAQFAGQRGKRLFTRLELAAGELPESRSSWAVASTCRLRSCG